MVAARKVKSEMAKTIGTQAVESTIAKLPGKTDTATVRAARSVQLKTGQNYTGQYLYERFVDDAKQNKEDLTLMDIVKDMVEKLELSSFDEVVGGMVKFAKANVTAQENAAKAANIYDAENPTWPIREAKAKLKTAQNHQNVMRNAWGALKFCADELAKKLNGAPLSYRMVREVGSALLKNKGINWKGDKIAAPEERQARREQETETAAMLAIQKANPRREGESRADYFARIDAAVEKQIAADKEQQQAKSRADLADKIRTMCGADLPVVLDLLLSGPEPEKAKESKTKPADIPTVKADKNLH